MSRDDRNGPTALARALELLSVAEQHMAEARALLEGRATKAKKLRAFRLLSGVEATCATLKIAIDPW